MHNRLSDMCMINDVFVATLLVKDEKTYINELYLMTIKFSANPYQYQGAKRANRYALKGSIMGG